jgi:aspartyl-tRNA(Asn)/glutamyl-tRNA(Gln) amidotransferase subunit A
MLEFDSVIAARNAVRQKRTSAQQLARAALDRITQLEPTLHAFNSIWHDEALAQARRIDAGEHGDGALLGVPIALKDNICTKHGTTTCSSRMLANFRSPYDAAVTEKLLRAGAVIVGKTNLDEFAMGSSTENSATGPTRNPWDPSRVPGGSSGGSAAAVAGGMVLAALGSDTGGSIRQPAALCGIVGLKPTYGRVSRYGLVAFASSLDQIGPLARTVEDAALLLSVISGHDQRDSTSAPDDVPDFTKDLDQPLASSRIGIVKQYALEQGIDPQVQHAFDEAIDVYRKLGAQIVELSLPMTQFAIAAYYIIAPCEASSNLARYDGIHFGHRTDKAAADIVELVSLTRAEGFGDEVKRRIMIGTHALSSGYYDAYYLRALKIRTLIHREFEDAFKQCDAIICPTSPTAAFTIGDKSGDPMQMYLSDIFTVTANIAGIPGISIPCGFTRDPKPLPIGLQLLGPASGEQRLLRLARMYEKQTSWSRQIPQIV